MRREQLIACRRILEMVSRGGGVVDGGAADQVGDKSAAAVAEQQPAALCVILAAALCGQVQGGAPALGRRLCLGAVAQQELDARGVTGRRGKMQSRLPARVAAARVVQHAARCVKVGATRCDQQLL